jgi:hypothetical protein
MDGTSRERLATAMLDRRRALRLSIRAAAQRAGVDRATWTSAENAIRQLAEYNYAGVEAALEWEPGSVEAVLAGDTATPRPAGTTATPASRDEEIALVADDPDLDNEMKQRIIEMIFERRERDRAAGIADTRRVIDLTKRRGA